MLSQYTYATTQTNLTMLKKKKKNQCKAKEKWLPWILQIKWSRSLCQPCCTKEKQTNTEKANTDTDSLQ